jgi:ubiquinone/menaquinone biosynthesis C-methylase UbiE
MDSQINYSSEQTASAAFDRQSLIFDELYSTNSIIHYKRERVRGHLLKYLEPGCNILELNSGTGDDAIFLAQNGHKVHATDISAGMQSKLEEKIIRQKFNGAVSTEICSFTALNSLKKKGPYDAIFSNFAGLNCTGKLDIVFNSFDTLLKPGGIVVLVMLPRFCLWETLLFLKGKFKTAGRRFFSSKGRQANIEGISITCWYYSPRKIIRLLKDKYKLISIEGLCTIVPPSYMEAFPEKYPGLFSYLCKTENRVKSKWPWKYLGDYYIISFQKASSPPEFNKNLNVHKV